MGGGAYERLDLTMLLIIFVQLMLHRSVPFKLGEGQI